MKQPRMGFVDARELDLRLHDGTLWEKRYTSTAVASMIRSLNAIETISPETSGQLHPVTITPNKLVVGGARRTVAQRARDRPVWVRYVDEQPLEVFRAIASLENIERKSPSTGQITQSGALSAIEIIEKYGKTMGGSKQ